MNTNLLFFLIALGKYLIYLIITSIFAYFIIYNAIKNAIKNSK